MSKKLLESDFLTVDINSIITKQTPETGVPKNSEDTETVKDTPKEFHGENFNWEKELAKRLKDNKALHPEARKTEYEIKSRFFTEYFKENWGDAKGRQLLLIGDMLQKDLIKWGFDPKVNPVAAFIKNKYVQDNLIQPGLLNSNTYRALHDAVVEKWVADSEFVAKRNYNIIYCKDLYKKPLDQIKEYLQLQAQILRPSSGDHKYKKVDLDRNRKIFFKADWIDEVDPRHYVDKLEQAEQAGKVAIDELTAYATELNSLGLAKALKSLIKGSGMVRNQTDLVHLKTDGQKNLVAKLNTPTRKFAAVQYLSMTTDSTKARAALTDNNFGPIDMEKLPQATKEITVFMPNGRLATKDADAIVDQLLQG